MVDQALHEYAASLPATGHAPRSRRLIKCAKDSGHYPILGPRQPNRIDLSQLSPMPDIEFAPVLAWWIGGFRGPNL